MQKLRIIVCGGRNYSDRNRLFAELDRWLNWIKPNAELLLIEGGATGADRLAREWAKDRGCQWLTCEAFWDDLTTPPVYIKVNRKGKKYNALAGKVRNQRMIDEGNPHFVIAFPGGSGTGHMVSIAQKSRIPVVTIESGDLI